MSRRAASVTDAVFALDGALEAYLTEEQAHGVPREVSAESILGDMPTHLVHLLLEHMPTIAGPWRVTDMRDGEPTRMVRDGYQDRIAEVKRCGTGKRARPRWAAFVGSALVSPPEVDENGDTMPIDWSTLEEAQDACDEELRKSGVRLEGER